MNIITGLHVLICLELSAAYRYSTRVIGGEIVTEAKSLYQVSVKDKRHNHKCGGSVIKPKFVLTTAWCIKKEVPSDVLVSVGSVYLNYLGHVFPTVQLITHPFYDNDTLANNVGVIKTAGDMLNAPKTRLVSLPIDFTYPGEDCTLFGWGKESYGSNSFSKRLRYVHLKVMSLADCQSRWSDQRVTIDNLCTGDIAGHGACIGDEGAPLVKNGMQIGMFSFGGMCIDGRPDVYVNVFNYITFINAVAID